MEEGLEKILESAVSDAQVKPVLEGTDGLEAVCRKKMDAASIL